MPSPLSVDLRERVVAAVRQGPRATEPQLALGSACRAPAAGRSARTKRAMSRPSRWRRSHLAAHRGACRTDPGDLRAGAASLLRELRDRLAEQGVQTSTSGLSRFFQRHAITWKRGRRSQLSRSVKT